MVAERNNSGATEWSDMGETTLTFVELWNKCSQTRVAIKLARWISEHVAFFYRSVGQQKLTFSNRFKKTVVPFVL